MTTSIDMIIVTEPLPEESKSDIVEELTWAHTSGSSDNGFDDMTFEEVQEIYNHFKSKYAESIEYSAHLNKVALRALGSIFTDTDVTIQARPDGSNLYTAISEASSIIVYAMLWAMATDKITLIPDVMWDELDDEQNHEHFRFIVPTDFEDDEEYNDYDISD